MRFSRLILTLVVALGVSACDGTGGEYDSCGEYAEMEARCFASTEGGEHVNSRVAKEVCQESVALENDWLSRRQAQELSCAQSSATCESYAECKWHITTP